VAAGYLSSLLKILPEESINTFTRYAFFIAMPCELLIDFAKIPVAEVFNLSYIGAFSLGSTITGSIIFFISRYKFKTNLAESALNIMGSSQVNTAYFAIPLFILVFRNATPAIPIMVFQILILTSVVLGLLEHHRRKKDSVQQWHHIFLNTTKTLFKTPIIVAAIVGIIFSFYHIEIPTITHKFLHLIGDTAAPIALFSLGQSLFFDLIKVRKKDFAEISLLVITKIIILPILAFVIGKYLFHLDPKWLAALVIMAGMPAPKNMFIFAVQYRLNTKKASAVVAITTLLSFITLNVIIILFRTALS